MASKAPKHAKPALKNHVSPDTISVSARLAETISEAPIATESFVTAVTQEIDQRTVADAMVYVAEIHKGLPSERIVHLYVAALRSKYAAVRAHGADVLRKLGPTARATWEDLCRLLHTDTSATVRGRAAWALMRTAASQPQVQIALEKAVREDPSPDVRDRAKASLDLVRRTAARTSLLTSAPDATIVVPVTKPQSPPTADLRRTLDDLGDLLDRARLMQFNSYRRDRRSQTR